MMKNVPCVCDFRPLLFAEQFERLSRLALVSVYAIALNKFGNLAKSLTIIVLTTLVWIAVHRIFGNGWMIPIF